jgi:hypothetical protein
LIEVRFAERAGKKRFDDLGNESVRGIHERIH